VALGPRVGAAITILLTETLRISFGTAAVGWDNLVYGALLASSRMSSGRAGRCNGQPGEK
jgi:hypothetical protein